MKRQSEQIFLIKSTIKGLPLTGYFKIIVLLFALINVHGCKERKLAEPTIQMEADEKFWIRVLLLDNVQKCRLEINSPVSIIESASQTEKAKFDNLIQPTNVEISDGTVKIANYIFTDTILTCIPDSPHIFSLNGDSYRANLQIIVNPDENSFDLVNLVPIEPYLAGVVGAEMPHYWELEALKAQAIAARTYCLYMKENFGKNRSWDVKKTQANQVYLGLAAESKRVWMAVNSTYGQVLYCKQYDGTEDIFPTYYSSACGGHTEDAEKVFGEKFCALSAVSCPYCKKIAKRDFFLWPEAKFKKSDVTGSLLKRYPSLEKLGEIEDIVPIDQSDYGKFSRLTMVKLIGSSGKNDYLRAEDLRLAIDPTGTIIRSTICKIETTEEDFIFSSGRGYGHGVGMCQCGAEAMARKGKKAKNILSYYYRDSKIKCIY